MPDVQAASIRFLQKSIRQQHVGNSRGRVPEGECRWCQARLPLDTAKIHVTQCDQIEKPCDLCSQLFKRMEIQQHQQECEYREIVCECGTRLKKKEEANHNSTTCAFKEEPCPLNCGERVKSFIIKMADGKAHANIVRGVNLAEGSMAKHTINVDAYSMRNITAKMEILEPELC
ncbi:hypothetical protein OS493_024258 [Desmophyllum pertusum]|uniref:TRAF-type domain-containing protein n=2 Tax=Desmophyllum pertusum TaxID=174260 RepID=A0A9W9YXX2_9CNID|nr:hypothetical protein OS493_024258 [Desmophyllum pertusum]